MSPRMRQITTMMRTRSVMFREYTYCTSAISGGLARFHTFGLKFIIVQGFRRRHLHSESVEVASRIVKTATRERFYPQSSDFTTRRLSLLASEDALLPPSQMLLLDHFSLLQSTSPFRKCPRPRNFQPLFLWRRRYPTLLRSCVVS